MANYKAVTADEVYMRGGTYNGETGSEKAKCVRYADRTTWCQNHGCTFNKVTNLNYSANSVIAIEDIMINSQQQEDDPVVVHKLTFDTTTNFSYITNFPTDTQLYNIFRVSSYRVKNDENTWVTNGDMNIPLSIGVNPLTQYGEYIPPYNWQGRLMPNSSINDQWTVIVSNYYNGIYSTSGKTYEKEYKTLYNEYSKTYLTRRIDIYFGNNPTTNAPYDLRGKKFCFVIGTDFDNVAIYLEHNQYIDPSLYDDNLGIGWKNKNFELCDTSLEWWYDKVLFKNDVLIPIINNVDIKIGRYGFAITFPLNSGSLETYESGVAAYWRIATLEENLIVFFVFHNFSV